MTMPLALLQGGGQDNILLYIMIGVTLLFAIALGRRFFVNLFEVITAPTASLHHHGRNETFFFSVGVVILGGLIGASVLLATLPQVQTSMKTLATDTGKQLAEGNSNPNYRDMAGTWATDHIQTNLDTYVVNNLQWIPMVFGFGLWIVVGFLFWIMTKMFGAQATLGNFLGALSYAYFFATIGLGLALPMLVSMLTNVLFGLPSSAQFDIPAIAGCVLVAYSLILFMIGVVQSAEIGGGQLVVCIVLFLIVIGGGTGASFYYQFMPKAAAFAAQVKSLDPSKAGFKMPGAEGGGAPPPPPPSAPPSSKPQAVPGGGVDSSKGTSPKMGGGGGGLGGSTSN